MAHRNQSSLHTFFISGLLMLLMGCGKDKQKVVGPSTDPPLLAKACRLTNYSTTEDLGGNGSQFAFSYDADFNLVQVTALTLAGYPGVKVTVGQNGVIRDNGLSIESWSYGVDIYKELPPTANRTIAAASPIPTKTFEDYRFDAKKRLYEVVEYDASTNGVVAQVDYTYSDNDDCTSITFQEGNSKDLTIYYATRYDTHPSAYTNIYNHEFMHWIDAFGYLTPNVKYVFDMASAHNILEWTQTQKDEEGAVTNYKSTFVYTYNATTGMPESRTETATVNDQTSTFTDLFTYTGCD